MMVLAERLWPAIAVAGVLGLLLTAFIGRGRSSLSASRLVAGLALAALAGAGVVVWLGIVPGRPGLWVETAVLVLAAYAAGSVFGALIRRALAPHSAGSGETRG